MARWQRIGLDAAARERGVAYLALMLIVAVLGLTAAYTARVGVAWSRHDAEEELLACGLAFQQALSNYANASPPGAPRAPQSLADLLRDPRQPGVVRHLRRVPVDPITGSTEWALVINPQNQIVGVHSASTDQALKQAGFPPALAYLEGAPLSYQQWIFYGPR